MVQIEVMEGQRGKEEKGRQNFVLEKFKEQ
jgi:hypothetical protein